MSNDNHAYPASVDTINVQW